MSLHVAVASELDKLKIRAQEVPGLQPWQDLLAALSNRLSVQDERERVLQLRTEQLEAEKSAALAAAEAAQTTKSNFLATMSHELRTPLNGILGMGDLMLGTQLSAQQREYADIIHQSARLLLGLVDQVLEYPKLQAGKVALELVPFDLRATLEGLADQFAPRAQEKGLEFVALVYRDVPTTAYGDPIRLRQIIVNLVSNAIKFTSKGEVLVRAKAAEQTKDTFRLVVEVVDTGIGIAREQRQQIFDAFVQGDETSTRRFGGIGLGLSMSRRLVDLMGGEMGLESKPGEGSTFWVSIPLQRPGLAGSPVPLPGNAKVVSPVLQGKRALVVDDNPVNLTVLHQQLSNWGLLSLCTSDGEKALTLLVDAARRAEPFDILLTDFVMPGMNGIELGRTIQADPEIAGVPMILLTSLGDTGQAEEARTAGFAASLTKPFQPEHLCESISNVLATSTRQAVPTRPESTRAQAATKPPAVTGPRLLVVEDNLVNQKVALTFLNRLGLTADVAPDGLAALHALEKSRYDAVLMDCQMPVMDGFKATEEIRRRELPGQHLPIIALTANAADGAREQCMAAGMDDYLTKPIGLEALQASLQRWVTQTTPAAPPSLVLPVPDVPAVPDFVPDLKLAPLPVVTHTAEELEACLDRDVLESLRQLQQEGEPDILRELAELFFDEAPRQVQTIHEALASNDSDLARRTAHTLKGSAANLGARPLAGLCEHVERSDAAGIASEGEATVRDIETELSRVMTALRAIVCAQPIKE